MARAGGVCGSQAAIVDAGGRVILPVIDYKRAPSGLCASMDRTEQLPPRQRRCHAGLPAGPSRCPRRANPRRRARPSRYVLWRNRRPYRAARHRGSGRARHRAVKHGRRALDALDELEIGPLAGNLDQGTLLRLKAVAADLKDGSGDQGLDQVLSEIDLRVAVELAKAGMN